MRRCGPRPPGPSCGAPRGCACDTGVAAMDSPGFQYIGAPDMERVLRVVAMAGARCDQRDAAFRSVNALLAFADLLASEEPSDHEGSQARYLNLIGTAFNACCSESALARHFLPIVEVRLNQFLTMPPSSVWQAWQRDYAALEAARCYRVIGDMAGAAKMASALGSAAIRPPGDGYGVIAFRKYAEA